MSGIRKLRENLQNRVYHLIGNRVTHRAFFLNVEERTRFVELLKPSPQLEFVFADGDG